jgi:hypothetical protein
MCTKTKKTYIVIKFDEIQLPKNEQEFKIPICEVLKHFNNPSDFQSLLNTAAGIEEVDKMLIHFYHVNDCSHDNSILNRYKGLTWYQANKKGEKVGEGRTINFRKLGYFSPLNYR